MSLFGYKGSKSNDIDLSIMRTVTMIAKLANIDPKVLAQMSEDPGPEEVEYVKKFVEESNKVNKQMRAGISAHKPPSED